MSCQLRPHAIDALWGPSVSIVREAKLDARGLFLDMPAWGYHVFGVTALDEAQIEARLPAEVSSVDPREVLTVI